jgi:pimeloyl-ACP methyl ester carboxylesterase
MQLQDGRDVTVNGLKGRLYSSIVDSGPHAGPAVAAEAAGAVAAGTAAAETTPDTAETGRQAYVLLHGIGVSHRYLAKLHQELAVSGAAGTPARDAVVYTFDLPGYGTTPRPGHQVSVAEYAAFVAAVLADEGVQSCVVVGHSMGVQFAVELALQQPDLVSRVVLMGPVVDPARKSAAWHVLALTRDAVFSEKPSTNIVVFSDYFKAGLRWYLTQLPVMLNYPMEQRTREVTQPVLVLRGGRDPIARRPWCEDLSHQPRHGSFVEVPGCGHVVQDSAPEAVARAIVHWATTADDGVTA